LGKLLAILDPDLDSGAMLWIRIYINADPDPAFYLNADPDPVRIQEAKPTRIQEDQDPDAGQTFKSQKVGLLHEKYCTFKIGNRSKTYKRRYKRQKTRFI
jgi:hypothetical protein